MRHITSCLFINSEPKAQRIFAHALGDMLPKTVCFIVNDGQEALEAMQDLIPVPDVIVMEANIIGSESQYFLRTLKQGFPLHYPLVIVHTVNATPAMAVALNHLGVFAINTKPYSYTTVRGMLELCSKEICSL